MIQDTGYRTSSQPVRRLQLKQCNVVQKLELLNLWPSML
jgi:hypothetical protein